MWSRRRFLELVSGLPIVGGLIEANTMPAASAAARSAGPTYFRENAAGKRGVRLMEAETQEVVQRIVNSQPPITMCYNNNNREGRNQDEAYVRFGNNHGIPTRNDAAADGPPVYILWKYTKMGFDLV